MKGGERKNKKGEKREIRRETKRVELVHDKVGTWPVREEDKTEREGGKQKDVMAAPATVNIRELRLHKAGGGDERRRKKPAYVGGGRCGSRK